MDSGYLSSDDSDFEGSDFDEEFDRKFDLRGRTVVSSLRFPGFETTTRSRTHYGYARGTDTTAETRDAAQRNVPSRYRNEWSTSTGASGSWEMDNPPPQRRGGSWATWGAGFGGAIGWAASDAIGEGVAAGVSSMFGTAAGQAVGRFGAFVTAPLGAALGYGLGAIADSLTPPRYDAGHTRANAIGGRGDTPEATFGQTPAINRGNHYRGQPTYDQHRRHERNEATAVRDSASSLHTTTLYW